MSEGEDCGGCGACSYCIEQSRAQFEQEQPPAPPPNDTPAPPRASILRVLRDCLEVAKSDEDGMASVSAYILADAIALIEPSPSPDTAADRAATEPIHIAALRDYLTRYRDTMGVEPREIIAVLDELRTLRSSLADAERDTALFAQLDAAYCAADFADEQFPDKVILKFALPAGTRVGADLRATLARAFPQSTTERSE